jgi:hypothetical protein
MYFPLRQQQFPAIVDFYSRHGFVVLTDVDPKLAAAFRHVVGETTGLTDEQIRRAGRGEEVAISSDARAKLARPEMTPELRNLLFATLGDLVVELLGPFIHVSNSYHPQIKRTQSTYILKGYSGDGLEVEAPYGLHQDFTAARLVTSPSAIVCWIPLNSCEFNALRVYSDTANRGMLTNRWLRPDEGGVEQLGPSVEVKAEEGQVLLFNFLVMHGTTRPGPATRISCDARFFPLCGILDSEATVLRPDPVAWIRARLREPLTEPLAGPLYEALAYLGETIEWPSVRQHSVLHWARVIEGLVRGDAAQVRDGVAQFVNTQDGFDPAGDYVERFAGLALQPRAYRSVLGHLSPEAAARCAAIAHRLETTGTVGG